MAQVMYGLRCCKKCFQFCGMRTSGRCYECRSAVSSSRYEPPHSNARLGVSVRVLGTNWHRALVDRVRGDRFVSCQQFIQVRRNWGRLSLVQLSDLALDTLLHRKPAQWLQQWSGINAFALLTDDATDYRVPTLVCVLYSLSKTATGAPNSSELQ